MAFIFPLTANVVDNVRNGAAFVSGVEEVGPAMGGEDFAYFAQEKPGCYFYTGVRNSEKKADIPHHHPMFDIDEDAMETALMMFMKILEKEAVIKWM